MENQRTTRLGGIQFYGIDYTDSKGTTVYVQTKDRSGNITLASGAASPSRGATGYAIGCRFVLTGQTAGYSSLLVNLGSATSCAFQYVILASTSTSSSSSSSSTVSTTSSSSSSTSTSSSTAT